MTETPELVWDLQAELAEGPVWVARDRAVWFVDIKGRRLHRYGVDDGSKTGPDDGRDAGYDGRLWDPPRNLSRSARAGPR